jgi:hypothetical protein
MEANKMVGTYTKFPRPKMMWIKYGKGFMKAKVEGVYTRYTKAGKTTSHKVKRLGAMRMSYKDMLRFRRL